MTNWSSYAAPSTYPPEGVIIWVSPDGDDLGNGSQLYPYATIDRALQDFVDGKQIRLMDGTYTPANTVVIDGISGSIFAENPNDATIQPVLGTIDSACISIKNIDRFSITGVNIVQPSNTTGNYVGLYVDNVTNFVAYSCNVSAFDFPADSAGYGILAAGSGRIERCSAYNINGNEIYGIKTTGIGVIDCEVTALSGAVVRGIDTIG